MIRSALQKIQWGDMVEVDAFAPATGSGWLLLGTGIYSSLSILSALGATPAAAAVGTATALLTGWLAHRFETRRQRNGWILDEPLQLRRPASIGPTEGGINRDITDLLRTRTGLELTVNETRSHQYRILTVANLEPELIRKQLPAISMQLGVAEAQLTWIQNFGPGLSAILVPMDNPADWLPVPFTTEHCQAGELLEFIGTSITGDPVLLNRRQYPHLLVTGMTGAGKTEAFVASIASVRASGMNPRIIIIDPKNTAQLKREQADYYTNDIKAGVAEMERLYAIAQERMERYSRAGCDNFFEYREKMDATEQPVFIYIDEIAAFLRRDLTEELEAGEKPRHARAFNIMTTAMEQIRSSGLFVTGGVQTSKATNIPTDVRDNFGARLIFATADANAAQTAGAGAAVGLPMQGGFIFKTGRTQVMGRGAYLKAEDAA